MRVDPKALVKRLTPTATRHLELAAGKAVSAQHYEIDVEHVLLCMLSDAEGECVDVLQAAAPGPRRAALPARARARAPARRQPQAAGPGPEPVLVAAGHLAHRVARVGRNPPSQRSAVLPAMRRPRAISTTGSGPARRRGLGLEEALAAQARQRGEPGGSAQLGGRGRGAAQAAGAAPRGGPEGARRASPTTSPRARARARSTRSSAATARSGRWSIS